MGPDPASAETARGQACSSCRQHVPFGARFCPACGAAVGDDTVLRLTPLGLEGGADGAADVDGRATADGGPRPSSSRRRNWTWLGLAALAALVLAILTQLDDPPDREEESAQEASTTTSTEPAPATTTSASTSTTAPAPTPGPEAAATLANPDLASLGALHVLFADGGLAEIDLASGATTEWTVPGLDADDRGQLVPLESGLLVQADGLITVLPWASPRQPSVVGLGAWYVAANGAEATVLTDNTLARVVLIDAGGPVRGPYEFGFHHTVLATVGDRVAVMAGNHVGLVEPATRDIAEVLSGEVLAASSSGIAWIDCRAILRCELRVGSWDEPGRHTIDLRIRRAGGIEAFFIGDGSHVVISSFGVGAPAQFLVDLDSGTPARVPLGAMSHTERLTSVSADGSWVATARGSRVRFSKIDPSKVDTGIEHTADLGREVIALSLGPARFTGGG